MPRRRKQPCYRRDRLALAHQQERMRAMPHAWIRIGAHQVAQRLPLLPLLSQLCRHAAFLPGTRMLLLPRSTIYAIQLSRYACAGTSQQYFLLDQHLER